MQMLRLGKKLLTTQAKEVLYFAQIYSHLSYGVITWGNMINQSQIKKLEILQKKCFDLIMSNKKTIEF